LKIFGIFLLSLIFFSSGAMNVFAGGAAAGRGQMQQRQQQELMMQRAMQQRIMQQKMAAQQAAMAQQRMAVSPEEVKDIATLEDVIRSLEDSSRAWTLIIDRDAKAMVIQQYVLRYSQEGVRIKKDPASYADLIDGMVVQTPTMLQKPFAELLKMVSIIEYDFDNGQSKDELAHKVLGSYEAVQANKKRLAGQM